MNPFATMVSALTAPPMRPAVVPHVSDRCQGATSTQTLLRLLDCYGPMTTRELCDAAGLQHTKLVWGLLKAARGSGQVCHRDGLWDIDADFPGLDVLRAAELLRQRGWEVQEPSS